MSENIQFKKNSFTVIDGYFYLFDNDTDVLYQKTADGLTSFSYPLDTLITNDISSVEYDGYNFWTLEDSTDDDSVIIRRWNIINYVCKQQQVINLNAVSGHKFNSDTFTVEHYHTTVSGVLASGSTSLYIDEYTTKLESGMSVAIGPNVDGITEVINVQGHTTTHVILADPTTVEYTSGTVVSFYINIWLFNNYDGEDSSSAALYKYNAYTGGYILKYGADEYKNITASTFYKISAFNELGSKDMLCFVKSTNMLFIDVNSSGSSLSYFGSMLLDNVEDNDTTIIKVYDLAIEGDNIYKLQKKANYFGTTESYGLAQYQVATQTSIVTSIALTTTPTIISANGFSTSTIEACVRDQFWQPVAGRLVSFEHDEPTTGSITSTPVNTDANGIAQTVFKAGTKAIEVKIVAQVEQL